MNTLEAPPKGETITLWNNEHLEIPPELCGHQPHYTGLMKIMTKREGDAEFTYDPKDTKQCDAAKKVFAALTGENGYKAHVVIEQTCNKKGSDGTQTTDGPHFVAGDEIDPKDFDPAKYEKIMFVPLKASVGG